jgi:hypothetical protein
MLTAAAANAAKDNLRNARIIDCSWWMIAKFGAV